MVSIPNIRGRAPANLDSVIYKLFLRAFPNHFKSNSIYAHYPMTIPRQVLGPVVALKILNSDSENTKIMRSLGRETQYSWDRPQKMYKSHPASMLQN